MVIYIMYLDLQLQPRSGKSFGLTDLIRGLDRSLVSGDCEVTVKNVRRTLERAVRHHPDFLPEYLARTSPHDYARHHIHTDPVGRYTLFAMVWDQDQETSLHDHDGLWVAECVYSGQIEVSNFIPQGVRDGLYQFQLESKELARSGDSDCRIPPFEHHIVRNAFPSASVSLHVFGGVMTRCNVFDAVEGGYLKREKKVRTNIGSKP